MALGNNSSLAGGRVMIQWVIEEQRGSSKGDAFEYAFQENLALTGTRDD